MSRLGRHEVGLLVASAWSLRGTCARRKVGCVLVDRDGHTLATGYNGPPSGQAHCADQPCAGAGLPSGTGLSTCEAIHAEANALLRCSGVGRVHTAYVTHSPCLDCVKLLLNTGCRHIVFIHEYAHDEAARERWTREPTNARFKHEKDWAPKYRTWTKWEPQFQLVSTEEIDDLRGDPVDNRRLNQEYLRDSAERRGQ